MRFSLWGLSCLFCFAVAAGLSGCGPSAEETQGEGSNASPGAAAQQFDWPLFRGDPEMQGVAREDLKAPLELAWTFEPPVEEGKKRPPFKASPVIAGGKVYVGGQDAKFYCLDLEKGTSVWTFAAEGTITAPAAVVGNRVFFGDTFGIVYGLGTTDGKEQWRVEADDKVEGGVNALEVTDPATGKKEWRIFFGSHDFNLYSVAAETGEVRWKHETENYVMATPSIDASLPGVIFGGCDGFLHIINGITGEKLHQVDIGQYVANSAAVRDGIAYVAHYGGEVVAVQAGTGEIVWKAATGVEYHGSPAVTATEVIVPGTDKRLAAFDRVTGKETWSFQGRRDFECSPVVCESAIWIGGMDGRIYALSPTDGTELWNYDLGAQIYSSPALSRGVLVICGEDGVVYGFRHAASSP
ncbi:MAG: PQQ-binding-like beta-propeller repeat protein [Verrucomicrobiae bacterium]|nr:PQQ-binding-like beta-propeller repeat protein [Verrucomicrobiae bacterium]